MASLRAQEPAGGIGLPPGGPASTGSWTTGQLSTQIPQPVQRSARMLRARLRIRTLRSPGGPSTDSRSAYVINSMFGCRPTSTSLGEMIHMAQSWVGKVLSSWAMAPPMEGLLSSR